jgi:hypothetical protein
MLIRHATQSAIRQNSTISYESTARIKTSETLANRSSSWFGHAIFVAVIAQSTLAVRHYKHEFECRTVSRVRSTSHAVRQTSFSTPINPGTAQHSSDSSICISPSLMTDKFLTPSSTRFHHNKLYFSIRHPSPRLTAPSLQSAGTSRAFATLQVICKHAVVHFPSTCPQPFGCAVLSSQFLPRYQSTA